MTPPPDPSEPRLQRTRLGAELRRLRLLAGLSGRALAAAVGIGQASVSRIERGQQVPSLPEVTAWAGAAKATEEQRANLVALTEAALTEAETWRARMQHEGLVAMQASVADLEASTRTHRCFQPAIVPGLLQTAEYARRMFVLSDVLGDGDYAGAVDARVRRQRILYEPEHRFEFVLTEAALRWRPGPPAMMAAQLDRIANVATLANVELGVIPADAELRAIPWIGFDIDEDHVDGAPPIVSMETPHAGITVTDPGDVEIYREQLARMREAALFGADAIALVTALGEAARG